MTPETMRARLQTALAPYRYTHSLRVAETAILLARQFGKDEDKARIAGLLHDCAKGTDDNPAPLLGQHRTSRGGIALALAAEANLAVTTVQAADPMVFLHAPLGAYVARRDYGVEDESVL